MTTGPSSRSSLTLIIAVYNNVRYLEYILLALRRQVMKEFEVVVADDGSGPAVAELVGKTARDSGFPIRHLWQEDEGFRKNRMLNRAIEAAQTDYLVFIDGDCLPHRYFLYDHQMHRQPMSLLCGRRVNLSRQLTERLTAENVLAGKYERLSPSVWLDGLLARSSNLEDGIRITRPFVRRLLHRNRAGILGCNFSVEKDLLERINGFNEEYRGPGIGEDTDIAFRLGLTGVRLVTLRYLAILYHLYHPATVATKENQAIFARVEAERNPICPDGLKKIAVTGR